MVTIVTSMITPENNTFSTIVFSKARRAILSLLYGHADDSFYLRQIARTTGIGLGPVQRALKQLTDAGVILRSVHGRQVYYQANPNSPVFPELKSLITKTAGIGDTLRSSLTPLIDRIIIAFIYGSIVRGEEKKTSDIDLLIVGNVTFSEVVKKLQPAQDTLGREINPTVYPVAEFKSKLAENNHFLINILSEPKIFLIGDENELGRMAEKRMGD
jgi:predicted nucleotidyltransferase